MTSAFKQRLSDHLELAKVRICALALGMAALGYWLGLENNPLDGSQLLVSLLGIALVGGASGTLNQLIECDVDGKMWRTLNRPIPAQRIKPTYALKLGVALGVVGESLLLFFVNPVTAVLGGLTLLFYLGIYTPSKRVSPNSTLIGAIPGALPPLMGFTASHGVIHWEGVLLFAVVFLWQIPHFLAIAWLYRADYARAGLPVLPVIDVKGQATARQVLLYLLALAVVAALPSVWGLTGSRYLVGMIIASSLFIFSGVCLAVFRNQQSARGVFLASIAYLPIWALLMVWDIVR